MVDTSRRTFVAVAATIPFAKWLKRFPMPLAPLIRYNAASPQGIAMLNTYAAAVKAMKIKNDGDPRSWVFQWYTHCVKGSSAAAQQAPQKAAAIAAAYPPGTPAQKAIALAAWSTCEAHYTGPGREDFFLPWHRMYVYFLESIIRSVSGVPTFTLPYWNYSVTGPARGVLPPQFRLPSDPIFGSLYVGARWTTPAVNGGAAIYPAPSPELNTTALNNCAYTTVGVKPGFCQELDFGLHGNVHVGIGTNLNMASVPWAANDPIFWMHHCNIDRLWASWNAAGRANPSTPAYLNQTYTFADGNGNLVVGKVSDFLSIAALNYRYDVLEPVKPCLKIPPFHPPVWLCRFPLIPIGPGPVEQALRPEAGRPGLLAQLPRLAAGERIYLTLRHLTADVGPDVAYRVYLELPREVRAVEEATAARYLVGTINFFHAAGHQEMSDSTPPEFSFDVTDQLRSLAERKQLSNAPRVTLLPVGKPSTDVRATIGEIALVHQ